MKETIITWKCPKCGKVIKSMYKGQLEYNKEAHILSHKMRGVNNVQKERRVY